MLIRTIRSGLAESFRRASVCAVDRAGRSLYESGDPDRPLFYRSAIKPFQAAVATEAGAKLRPEWLAVACGSHGGLPVHLAIVAAILDEAGVGPAHLACPPSQPLAPTARQLLAHRGAPALQRIYHNCSGKHAAMLAASAAASWPLDGYLQQDHPLQERIYDLIAETTAENPGEVGVDGCGAPTFRGSIRGLARSFAILTHDSRFAAPAAAMSRFPSLVADNLRRDGQLGAWWGGPVKAGAQGLIAVARHGVGIAAKSDDGSLLAAVVAVIHAARRLGMLPDSVGEALADLASPPVLGGGREVGAVTSEAEDERLPQLYQGITS